MSQIKIQYGSDTVIMSWDGAQASAQILADGEPTGYQTADARHRTAEAVRLVARRAWPESGDFAEGSEAWDELEYETIDGYRAYDTVTEWMGPVRETVEAAERDVDEHNRGCAKQGGYGSAIVVQRDPEAPGRCVDLDGAEVWPPHGRTSGTVRWAEVVS